MQSVLVLGLGKSGLAAVRHALAEGYDVTVYAGKRNEAAERAAAQFEEQGATIIFDSEDVEGAYDICIASPGIPQTGNFYKSAAAVSVELVSEPEWAWRSSPQNWIAVTGTNGKTTTTSLVAHLLNQCGFAARACGNIGNTCLEAVEIRATGETLVAEMSSYQLASTDHFAPRVSVLLNITPDHLSWHGGFDSYAQAKFKVFDNLTEGSTAVVTSDVLDEYPDIITRVSDRGALLFCVGRNLERSCAYEDERGMLVYVDAEGVRTDLVSADELEIKGSHNVENALCASVAAIAYGCDPACVREGLRSFKPLEHRIEPCGTVDGVSYFNDSKATNVDATLKALTAFPRQKVVLLLGGRDKGTDLSGLVAACEDTCRAVVSYGEAGERFHDAFEASSVPCYLRAGMREALECARGLAIAGDAILLSPACASFDEFDSFEHRGEVFKECVRQALRGHV